MARSLSTEWETRALAEYERIIEFAEQVKHGVHPRVKIPSHLVRTSADKPPKIDYTTNYYSILFVQPSVNQDAIMRAYTAIWNHCSPLSNDKTAITKWASKETRVVNKIKKEWNQAQDAFKIISNPHLRAKYDDGRSRFASDRFELFDFEPASLDRDLKPKEAALEYATHRDPRAMGELTTPSRNGNQMILTRKAREFREPGIKVEYEDSVTFWQDTQRNTSPVGKKARAPKVKIKRERDSDSEANGQACADTILDDKPRKKKRRRRRVAARERN